MIDTTNGSNSIIRTDALGTFSDLKVSPDGTRLYGTSGGGLTVIDTSTMTAVAVPVGPTWDSQLLRNEYVNSVGNVAVSPDGKRAYVTFGATIAERGAAAKARKLLHRCTRRQLDGDRRLQRSFGHRHGTHEQQFQQGDRENHCPPGRTRCSRQRNQPLRHERRWQDRHRHQHRDQHARGDVHHRPDSVRWPGNPDHLLVLPGLRRLLAVRRQHHRVHPVHHGGSERHGLCHGLHRRKMYAVGAGTTSV